MKEWVESLCVLCTAAALSDLLLPPGNVRNGARLVTGLALTGMFVGILTKGMALVG